MLCQGKQYWDLLGLHKRRFRPGYCPPYSIHHISYIIIHYFIISHRIRNFSVAFAPLSYLLSWYNGTMVQSDQNQVSNVRAIFRDVGWSGDHTSVPATGYSYTQHPLSMKGFSARYRVVLLWSHNISTTPPVPVVLSRVIWAVSNGVFDMVTYFYAKASLLRIHFCPGNGVLRCCWVADAQVAMAS